MPWRNGEVPESELVIFKRGRNSTDGDWYWGLPPASYQRHLALVDRAFKRTGRWLSPSDGWSTYRPLHAQELARRIYGNGAAVPRTSSHGLFWEGRETAAVDYGNWAWVYQNHGGRAVFFDDCRAVGLAPDMISPRRGYPDEPWHVIDLNPRSMPAFAGGNATPIEEDDMPSEAWLNGMGADIVKQLKEHIDSYLQIPGAEYGYPAALLNVLRHETAPAIGAIAAGGILFPGAEYNAFVAIVNTVREQNGQPPLDADQVAGELAPLLAQLLPSQVASLSDADVARVAKAAADERDRRERERLAS